MKIEIAEHGRMSESGSSLLRLIQNQDMPLLDLLVREAIQNSLDAAKDNNPVNIDFRTGSFTPSLLNKNFEKIGNVLDERFDEKNGPYEFIEIRDSNTRGLTGPIRYSDVRNNDFGNLLKLVYEISKPQQAEGAGGSWGLGKTIYFRLGIGLVIYYSRIKKDGKYVSRLAACLVENETKKESVIPYSENELRRGIAWWGRQDDVVKQCTIPVENESEISQILSIFNLAPFLNEDTGTSIIIPYIDQKKLLDETYAVNEDKEHKPYWTNSIESYLNVAVQRWYAPRIENKSYPFPPYLSVSINGRKILPEEMLPLFRVVRELHIRTFSNDLDDSSFISRNANAKKETITLRNVFDNDHVAGWLTFLKINTEDLKMTPPDNEKSPYHQISNKNVAMENGNVPIIMYTRKLGMIVGYDYNGIWTHNMPRCSENEFIIGLFTLNSGNRLKFPNLLQEESLALEEYIRQGEKADHASWIDRIVKGRNPHIVQNIQKNIIRKITANYSEKKLDAPEKKNIALGHALANMLLPPSDFGKAASLPTKTGGRNGNIPGARKTSYFKIIGNPVYSIDKVSYNFEMHVKQSSYILELLVATNLKKIGASSWEDSEEIGKKFPLSFVDFSIESYKNNSKFALETKCDAVINEIADKMENEFFAINKIRSKEFGIPSSLYIVSKKNDIILHGALSFQFEDSNLKGFFDFREVENGKFI